MEKHKVLSLQRFVGIVSFPKLAAKIRECDLQEICTVVKPLRQRDEGNGVLFQRVPQRRFELCLLGCAPMLSCLGCECHVKGPALAVEIQLLYTSTKSRRDLCYRGQRVFL